MSMWKASAFSNATRNGLFAVQLAREGMTGPSPIFEGEKGFMKLVSGPFDLPALGGEGRPATPFKISDTYIKHYPVEYHAQTAVEAALLLRQELVDVEGRESWRRIERIEIGSYDVAIEIIGKDEEKWHPRTRETADHSFPYCVAAALLDGTITWRSFGEKRLGDARLRELMQKVRVVQAPDFIGRYPEAMPTRVTVRTVAGKEYTRQVDVPLGHPRNAMSDREVEDKFRSLAARQLNAARVQRIIDAVWTLDRCSDVAALMPLLKVGRG
jgi:2-methylcitrate dehydratase